jgi:uncharacterized integral membrane protein
MRRIYLGILLLLALAMLIFAVQNLGNVAVDFLWLSTTTPLAILVAASYVLGMVTGGSLRALIRRSRRHARAGR